VGVTVVQSIGDALVVGATARVVWGSVATLVPAPGSADAALDAVDGLDGHSTVAGDVDVGVLARLSHVRIGFAARNLVAPEFTAADGTVWPIERQARVGIAVVADRDRSARQLWVVSVDADLRSEDTAVGDRRELAVGGERWFFSRRLGVRGGVNTSTTGDARPAGSGGASVGLARGMWIEVQVTRGGDMAPRGWGVSAHLMF
jgi:hypothetical protein